MRKSQNGTALDDDDTVQGRLHEVEIISSRPMMGPSPAEIEDVSKRIAELRAGFARAGWRLESVRITRVVDER